MRYEEFVKRFPIEQFDPKKKYEEPEWLIENLWLSGGKINGIFGPPKSGKSRLLGWFLVSLLAGRPSLSLTMGRSVSRVLYFRAEESEEDISNRLVLYAALQNVNVPSIASRLRFVPAMNMQLERSSQRDNLRKMLEEQQADLLIIDPYVRIHGAEENDATAMSQIHNFLRSVAEQQKLDILLLHHTGKVSEEYIDETNIGAWSRGSSDIVAVLDTATLVYRKSPTNVDLYRAGRYKPVSKLRLTDRGDQEGWLIADQTNATAKKKAGR